MNRDIHVETLSLVSGTQFPNSFMQDLALNSEMFHVATLSEDDSDAAPLLPEASPRTQRKFDTVRQEDVNFATFFVLENFYSVRYMLNNLSE